MYVMALQRIQTVGSNYIASSTCVKVISMLNKAFLFYLQI